VHVTFVCEANQARSPVAAALFSAELARRQRPGGRAGESRGNWTVDSAGVFAAPHVPAMPEMQDLAAARGVDLTAHRSRALDEHGIAVADLLLTMTREQADLIGLRATGVVTRCFVLDELVALLDAVANVPVPTGAPDGASATTELPDDPRARVLAAHARRPFRLPDPEDDIADPLPGSSTSPEAAFARIERSVAALATLLLDDVDGSLGATGAAGDVRP
jgi:protein-tyrosine phosphatase